MSYPSTQRVLDLKSGPEKLSNRDIAAKLKCSASSIDRILQAAGGDGGTPAKPGGDGGTPADGGTSIMATVRQRTAKLNPWIELIYDAAVQQLPELKGVSFDDFVFQCCDFVKDYFHLNPPGWSLKPTFEHIIAEQPGWKLPQVIAHVERMKEEARYAQAPGPGSGQIETEPCGEQPGPDYDIGPSGE